MSYFSPEPNPSRLKAWLWKHGGEHFIRFQVSLYAHSVHWRQRHRWMLDSAPIQIVQWAMAVISGGLGFAFLVTPVGQSGSPVMDMVDLHTAAFLVMCLRLVHLPVFAPHQALGAILAISSALLIAAVYEWPMDEDLHKNGKSPVAKEITDAMLRRLLRWHLIGHMAGLLYWGMYAVTALSSHKMHLSWIWFGVCFTAGHAWLYIRCNREYSKELAKVRRIQQGKLVKPVSNGNSAPALRVG